MLEKQGKFSCFITYKTRSTVSLHTPIRFAQVRRRTSLHAHWHFLLVCFLTIKQKLFSLNIMWVAATAHACISDVLPLP